MQPDEELIILLMRNITESIKPALDHLTDEELYIAIYRATGKERMRGIINQH